MYTHLKSSLFLSKVLVSMYLSVYALSAHAKWYSDTQGIMGTEVSVTLWHSEAKQAERAIEAVMNEMRRIDQAFSPYIPSSELAQLNTKAFKAPQTLSDELAFLIDKSLFYSKASEGAFDITFASLAQHYDYRNAKSPDKKQREEALPAINYKWLEFDASSKLLKYKHDKVKIDLGGIAKGYAVDRAVDILEQHGVKQASVSAGGDSRVLGDRRGRPWIVGIKNPRLRKQDTDEAVIRLPLEDVAVSTSGDYERYFINEDGERVHHIINPRTGNSASEVMSVTVLGALGADTDPLSTSIFVLGVEKGLRLVNLLPQFDVIIIDAHGKVHYSKGLAAGT